MTEADWLASADPAAMLRFFAAQGANRRKTGRRKLRLFGCAVCRQRWEHLTDPRSRQAVEVAERLADNVAEPAEVETTRAQAWDQLLTDDAPPVFRTMATNSAPWPEPSCCAQTWPLVAALDQELQRF